MAESVVEAGSPVSLACIPRHGSVSSPHPVAEPERSAEECLLDPDEAMPLGLIANEAVTNAFKHAFPGRRKGEIKVSFRHDETGALRLVVRDNGVGFQLALAAEASGCVSSVALRPA